MFEHLSSFKPEIQSGEAPRIQRTPKPDLLLDAKYKTARFNDGLVDVHADDLQAQDAALVFDTLTDSSSDPTTRALAVEGLRTSAQVQRLVAMLTTYEWDFVTRAQEIRGYIVAQLLEETKDPQPRNRLRALELLGKVTEVALFTERVEVQTSRLSDEQLEAEVRSRISGLLTRDAQDVEDISEVNEAGEAGEADERSD